MQLSPSVSTSRPVLSVSAGQRDRDYRGFFFDHDQAAIGPDKGAFHSNRDHYGRGERGSIGALHGVQEGDVVVMNVGEQVVGVGRVEEGGCAYEPHMPLQGHWDLVHRIRVKWLPPVDPDETPPRMGSRPRRAQRLGSGNRAVSEWAREKCLGAATGGEWARKLLPLPEEEPKLDKSLHPKSVMRFSTTIDRSKALWNGLQDRHWDPPASEAEAIAIVAVPLLLDLGWPPEGIALEWKHADVALFREKDRNPSSCALLMEAKHPGSGLGRASGQAYGYAETNSVRDVPMVATDGFTFSLFDQVDLDTPVATAFLPDLRSSAVAFFEELMERAKGPCW